MRFVANIVAVQVMVNSARYRIVRTQYIVCVYYDEAMIGGFSTIEAPRISIQLAECILKHYSPGFTIEEVDALVCIINDCGLPLSSAVV